MTEDFIYRCELQDFLLNGRSNVWTSISSGLLFVSKKGKKDYICIYCCSVTKSCSTVHKIDNNLLIEKGIRH